MINQLIHWADMIGTVLEALVLLRLLSLKLQRVYTFITLYWAVNVILDGASWFLGWDSPEASRLQIYSLFMLAALFPLASWDAFEEMKATAGKIRLMLASRMVSGLFFAALLAALFTFFMHDQLESEAGGATGFFGEMLWLVSASASLLFLLNLYRFVRKQSLPVPRNSAVWVVLFGVLIGGQLFTGIAGPASLLVGKQAFEVSVLIVATATLAATVWGLIRMRAIPTDISSEPERASLS